MEEETIVIKIPKAMKEEVEEFIKEKEEREKLLEKWNEMLKNSKLTEEDCIKLGRLVKKRVYEKLKKQGLL